MRSLPADMLTLTQEIPPPEEWIIACLKMPSGDVWLSDRPVSAALLALLPVGVDPLPIVEDWGTLDDGQGIDKILAAGSSGYLCAPKTRIVLIRADQTKADVDTIISQGIHNRRIELYRWFTGMTSAPVLIDTLFCQDRIELSESSMLFSFDAVGALASENPYMTDRANGQKNWPYLIGKAEGVPLKLLEEESSKWTVLLGDKDGEKVGPEYTGLIRVEDATKLNSGQHLINGEEVTLARVTAGYMEITARAGGGTEAQEHAGGSRIFPINAVFKYAVCAGPVGSLEDLRTSNEIDIYDEDGDLDTTEYRDLYSSGNEEYHPELNPAQIWFNNRMPWLKKDQDFDIEDRVFYGDSFEYSDDKDIVSPEGINAKTGNPAIRINFQRFSEESNDYWYKDTDLCLPGLPNDTTGLGASTYQESGLGAGYFEISQSTGEYNDNMSSTAYRQILINDTCPDGAECWTSTAPILPPQGWYNYTVDGHSYGIVFQRVYTEWAGIRVRVAMVRPDGSEELLNITTATAANLSLHGVVMLSGHKFDLLFPGEIIGGKEWFPTGYTFSDIINFDDPATFATEPPESVRLKMYVKMEQKGSGGPAWGFIRIGGKSQYSDKFHYGMAAFWRYYDNNPSAWISSSFGRDNSSLGIFGKAKVRIKGVVRNTNNFADGIVTIYEKAITDNYIYGATYTATSGEIDLSGEAVGGLIQDGETVAFINTENEEWDRKNFVLTATATPGVFTVSPAPDTDHTFPKYSNLIRGAWKSLDLSDGNKFDEELTLSAASWDDLATSKITVKVALDYLLEQTPDKVEGKERISGYAGVELDGGVEWPLSYTATNLDGIQINYVDTLYVDAVSSRGADWTPAEAFKWLSEDKTSWAADMLDLTDIGARHAEYETAGHYLNGLLNSDRYQGAIKEIARQGFFLPFQDGGRVSLQSYLSWPSTVSVSGDNDSILEASKTFETTDTNSIVQRLVIDYKKNFSTGLFDGQYELNTGSHVEQTNSMSLDLVSSESAVILLANWLFSLKSIQLKCLGFDGNFRLIESQSWDKIELPDFLAGDLQAELIVTGVQQQFAQPKNDRPAKFTIKTIKV